MSEKIKCTGKCGRELSNNNFYNSKSPLFPGGKATICKSCIKELINYDDMESIYSVFRLLDIPFFANRWEEMILKNPKNPFGNYIRVANSGLNEFSGARWKDSCFVTKDKEFSSELHEIKEVIFDEFKPTKEMILRWGNKYTSDQYMKLENFFWDMKNKNAIETPQDIDYLKKLSVISMKMDAALEEGNFAQVKQLGDLFSKFMADSKFRAMDKSETDKTGGIRTFGVIYAEVEREDFIPPWEHYRQIKGLTQDIVDKCIMHIENFTLRLNKVERMTEPPIDTPKLIQEETDVDLGDEYEQI